MGSTSRAIGVSVLYVQQLDLKHFWALLSLSVLYMITCVYEQRHFAGERALRFSVVFLAPYRFNGQEVWRQYRASVWLKPYLAKQCSRSHVLTVITNHLAASHLQCHPCLVSCAFYTIPILHIFNSKNFYLLVSLIFTAPRCWLLSRLIGPDTEARARLWGYKAGLGFESINVRITYFTKLPL